MAKHYSGERFMPVYHQVKKNHPKWKPRSLRNATLALLRAQDDIASKQFSASTAERKLDLKTMEHSDALIGLVLDAAKWYSELALKQEVT